MIKKMLFLLVIILIGFGIFYLYQDSNQLKVSYSRVKQTDYYEKILTTVIVLLEGLTKIKTEVSGKIIDLMSIEGDEIKAGQVLLKFETIDVFLDLKQVEANYSLAKARYDEIINTTCPTSQRAVSSGSVG